MSSYISTSMNSLTQTTSRSMAAGDTLTLYYYSTSLSTNESISTSSSNTSIATVAAGTYYGRPNYYHSFIITAHSAGSCTITVSDGSNSSKLSLTVTGSSSSSGSTSPSISGPSSIDISDSNSGNWVFTASGGTYDSADWTITENGVSVQSWSSGGDTLEVTQLSSGDSGSFTVKVTNDQGYSASKTVTVTYTAPEPDETYITSLSLSTTSITLTPGGSSASVTLYYSPSDATNKNMTMSGSFSGLSAPFTSGTGSRTYTFSAASYAEPGTYSIVWYPTDNSSVRSPTLTITVRTILITSLSINGPDSIEVGSYGDYSVSISPSNANPGTYTWSWTNNGHLTRRSITGGYRATGESEGTETVTVRATDGSGLSDSKTITVYDPYVRTESLTISDANPVIEIGQSKTITVTAYPSDTDDSWGVSSFRENEGGQNYFSFTRSTSGNVMTITITASSSTIGSGGYIRVHSGDVYESIYVTVEATNAPVTDITFAYLDNTALKIGESESATCTAWPSFAADRSLVASAVQGSQYVTVESTATDTGCRFTLTVNSAPQTGSATVVVRVQAQDDGAYYEDVTFTITRIHYAGAIQFSPFQGTVFTAEPFHVTVQNLRDESCSLAIVGGTGEATLSHYTTDGSFYINGVSAGTVTIRATSSDTGVTCEGTYTVSDEFPYDATNSVTVYYGEYNASTISTSYAGRLIHGGNDAVTLQSGVTWRGASIIPAYSDSALYVSSASNSNGPLGSPTELGERVVYLTDPTSGTTTRMTIIVAPRGEYTKQVIFDARVPEDSYLILPCPANLSQDYTTEDGFDFYIPDEEPTAEGQVFVWWEVDEAVREFCNYTHVYSGMTLTVTGQDTVVTLHAVWFPVLEWCTVTSTRSSGEVEVLMEVPVNAVLDAEIPNLGLNLDSAYPITNESVTGGTGIQGVSVYYGGTEIALEGHVLSSGSLRLKGTPTTMGETLTFTSLDAPLDYVSRVTRYSIVVVDAPALPDTGQTTSITLDAAGGVFPSGQGRVTMEVMDGSYVLPDWSVVDRPGYRLSGWTGSYSGAAAMGSVQDTKETWTAQWVSDSRGYDTRYLPKASIRIYRSLLEYIDCTDLQPKGGRAVVQIAENQTGLATFTLVNDYKTAGHALLADDCSLWNSGSAGPIQTGMYVRIDNINANGTVSYLMDGFVTSLSANGTDISVEVGDRMTFLGKTGATYRRNFYGSSRTSAYFPAGSDTTGLYADVSSMPADAIIDGTCYWTVRESVSYASSASTILTLLSWGTQGSNSRCTISIPTTHSRIESLTLPLAFMGATWPAVYTYDFDIKVSSGDNSYRYSYNISADTVSMSFRDFVMDLGGDGLEIVDGVLTLELTLIGHTGSQGGAVRTYRGTGDWTVTLEDGSYNSHSEVRASAVWSDLVEVTGRSSTATGGKLYVTEIGGGDVDVTDSALWTPSAHRARIPYITGSQSVISIAQTMAWGIGLIPIHSPSVPDAELVMFRTGGGYALDYLQTLADVADASGRRRAFTCRGFTTPMLTYTARHTIADTAQAHIHYGGDSPTGSAERIAFSAFNPSMTMKNRPNMAIVRGTMSSRGDTESRPIIVAVEDDDSTTRRFGLVVETVLADSSVNLAVDAASSAWGKVRESDLDEWEGTVTVPNIRRDLLPASGTYGGSGVPLLLTDSRLGITGARARARQLKLDYNACTTTVTLTNRSMAYASGIADTTAMAVTTADVATGDNSITLYNTQYVRIKTDTVQNVSSSGNSVVGVLSGDVRFPFEDVAVLQLPNGRSVLVAAAPADPDAKHASDSSPYDVQGIIINSGVMLEIRQSQRPDYYAGQTLVVNVDFPTS